MQKQYKTEWPPELPERLRGHLERLAKTIAEARAMQDTLLPSDMKKDAKAIATAAAKLLEMVREFSKNYGVAIYENYRTSAIESIKDDLGEMSEDELRRFGHGMDVLSLQHPLLGLYAYMQVLASIPGKAGPREAHLERYAVKETKREFERLGLPTSSNEGSAFFRACRAVLERSGDPAKSSNAPNSEAAVSHYIRAISRCRNLEKP